MPTIDTGSSTTGKADVNANYQLEVHTPTTETQAGFVQVSSEVDAGSVTGTRLVRALEASGDYRLRVGQDSPFFAEQFPGAAINTAVWNQASTTATITVTGGFLTLNAAGSLASGAVARVQTYRSFPVMATYPVWGEFLINFAQTPVTSNVCEWGFGFASGTTAPTDGAFFRLDATGLFKAVVNFNGTEKTSSALTFATVIGGANVTANCVVGIYEDHCEFWVNDILVANTTIQAAWASSVISPEQPILMRTYNSGVTGSAQVMKIGLVSVTLGDAAATRPWSHAMAAAGLMGYQGQTGGTMGTTASYANSTNPTAAVPTNTTAALTPTGLGGQFWETDTLAANTDGIISSFQVPAGTVSLPGRTLIITGVKIDSYVQTVLGAGGYVAQWSLAFGHTAVSLATAEAAGTKAPRRVALGVQAVATLAAVNTVFSTVQVTFNSPIAVQPGEFVQTVKKKVGTASASGTIVHVIVFDCYYE